ncbi:MAG: hypothetical protein U0575_00635 [Phycisphaerales bacterium]
MISTRHRSLPAAARLAVVAVASTVALASPSLAGVTQSTGPTPYRQFSDGLFGCIHFASFQLEDFEDHLLNTPGISADAGFVTSSQFATARDSVDLDDGDLNESSYNNAGTYLGDSWYTVVSTSFSFDPVVIGGFPTHAGLVLTDATFAPATVTAYDEMGQPFASIVYDFPDPGDSSCADDWFYGFFSSTGISRIEVSVGNAIEIDHIQYGFSDLRAASDLDGNGTVDGGDLGLLLSNWGTPCLGELTGDFVIDGADLGVLLANWGG